MNLKELYMALGDAILAGYHKADGASLSADVEMQLGGDDAVHTGPVLFVFYDPDEKRVILSSEPPLPTVKEDDDETG